jgi:sarcosine oxidase subunit delta
MKIMVCPLNGARNISEFACHGEVCEMPPPTRCSDADWAAHVWMRENRAGVVREWWCHLPTSYWFIAERDTRTDAIQRTYPAKDLCDSGGVWK